MPCRNRLRGLGTNAHVEQHCPILEGLQREPDQDQCKSEDAHALFRHMVRTPFNSPRACARECCDYSNCQSSFHADAQGVQTLMRHQSGDRSGYGVANGAIHCSEKLIFRQTKTSDGLIVNRRPHARAVCYNLSHGTKRAEDSPKYGAVQIPKAQAKAGCTNSTRRQVIPYSRPRSLPRSARKLPGERESVRCTAREPKYWSESEAVPYSEKRPIRDSSCERPQWPVLSP